MENNKELFAKAKAAEIRNWPLLPYLIWKAWKMPLWQLLALMEPMAPPMRQEAW